VADLRWTEQASDSLKSIHDYIAEKNPKAAGNATSELLAKTETIGLFPDAGYRYRDVEDGVIRILPFGHYRIAYLVANSGVVVLLGFFHGAMEIDRYLPEA
jgi:plasmid stabilization system protein ParE